MSKIKILIIGYQKASLKIFFDSAYHLLSDKYIIEIYKGSLLSKNSINKSFSEKEYSFLKAYDLIITGTSETLFEKNIWNYCFEKNLKYVAFVDSLANIKIRFSGIKNFPKTILTTSNVSSIKIKNIFPVKSQSSKIINIGFISHIFLKRKIKNNIKQNSVLYLTSDVGIQNEIGIINNLIKYSNNKKYLFNICVHPRENMHVYRSSLEKKISGKVYQNKFYSIVARASEVYGISTMGLLDSHIAGRKVFYYKHKKYLNSIFALFSEYGINHFEINKNQIIRKKNKSKIKLPNQKIFIDSIKQIIKKNYYQYR